MQRPLLPILILAAALVIGLAYYFYGGLQVPTVAPSPQPDQESAGPNGLSAANSDVQVNAQSGMSREAVDGGQGPLLNDPEIRAGLCGFRGRVVNHAKVPVADCGVRIYRGAVDSILKMRGDLFADEEAFEPQYIAGEVRTAVDGKFEMTGVWPRGLFLMFAGLGTDAPTHQVISQTPSAGEIVDLGDVVLNDAGVIVGTVVDDDGNPLAGALVRAVDIPGAIAAFFPAERFDPEGAILMRMEGAPMQVLRMPPWVKRAFDHLPIPTTLSGSDGSFRLVGVMPGINMLAATSKGYLSCVKSSVKVRSGAEKDVGDLRLREGEELYAKVLDQEGEPVAGAEVVAGSTLSMVPMDLASYLGETNEQGEIDGAGFSSGKVTVAARRSKDDAWVLAEPQMIINDVIVTLPSQYGCDVYVHYADGNAVKSPRFRLLRGDRGNGAAEMFMLGFTEAVQLDNRISLTDEGQWQITGLNEGPYTLLAEVAGKATGSASFSIDGAKAEAKIVLVAPTVFSVRVSATNGDPIRNAEVFAEPRGPGKMFDMPLNCGRTDEDGRLVIDKIQAERLRVSATHPKWGTVHGETETSDELLLVLQEPGSLRGIIQENGRPPIPGKFTVVVQKRRGRGPRGTLEAAPQLVTADLDGNFIASSLQPGSYVVQAINSIDSLRSPGGVFGMMSGMLGREYGMDLESKSQKIEIAPGQVAAVQLEVGKKPLDGPIAELSGIVMVNGRAGEGYMISASGGDNRFRATTDERGRFAMGTVSAGDIRLQIRGGNAGFISGFSSICSMNLTLAEGEQRDLTLDLNLGAIAGTCYFPDGRPAPRARVQGRYRGKSEARETASFWAVTDAAGKFSVDQALVGKWVFNFSCEEKEDRWSAELPNIEVLDATSLLGLRVDLRAATVVRGTVDLSNLTGDSSWRYIQLQSVNRDTVSDPGDGWVFAGGSVDKDGRFLTSECKQGEYQVTLTIYDDSRENRDYDCGTIVVPEGGLRGVTLIPRAK